VDYRYQNATDLVGGAVVNSTVPGLRQCDRRSGLRHGADLDVDGGGVYTAATFTTLLTRSSGIPGGAGNGLAGLYVNPDLAQVLEFYILASTGTTLTCWGTRRGSPERDTFRATACTSQARRPGTIWEAAPLPEFRG